MNQTDATSPNLADVASMRHKTYLLLGSLFHYPDEHELDEVSVVAAEIGKDISLIRNFPFYGSLRRLLESLDAIHAGDIAKHQSEHVGLFQIGTPETPCPPYESYYVAEGSHMAGWIMSQVESSYAAGGFTMTDTAKKELPDHIGHELQYMSILCGKETEARDEGDPDRVAESINLQRMFLQQHLMRWVPKLARRLKAVAGDGSFYITLTEATHAFVIHDGDLIETLKEAGIFSLKDISH